MSERLVEQHGDGPSGGQVAPVGPAAVKAASAAPATACDYAYYKAVFAGRAMPFAFCNLDLLERNIHDALARAQGKRVRVASKSVRSVAMLRRILAADGRIQGIMCLTAREAIYLASQGFDDVLIGYPAWHADDLAAVARAVAGGARITLMVDCLAQVERAEAAAQAAGVRLPMCLDVDLSLTLPGLHFGVWRSPVRTPEQARPIIERSATSPHVLLDGIMGYEAQISGVGDNAPGQRLKNALVRQLKRHSARAAAERRAAVVALAGDCGVAPRFVNGGGTGSIAITQREAVVTEITVGSAFYGPALFDHYRDFRYQPAVGFVIEIVRQPAPGIYTCLGGGYVASGAAGRDKLPQPYLPVGARLDPLEGAGEVQTPIRYSGSEHLAMGDPILMRHAKAGELCERFTHLLLVRGGAVVDEVTTYRGDGQCFL